MVIAGRLSICSSLSLIREEEVLTHSRAARRAVAAVITAGDLPVEDIAAAHRAVAIAAATPEVVRGVVRPAEALRLQAAILRQDIMAVDSSHPGSEPPSSHRSPSGGPERSLLLSPRMAMDGGNINHQQSAL